MAKAAKKAPEQNLPYKEPQVTRDEFVNMVMENRAKQDAPPPAPPKPTPAQWEKIKAEMERGAEVSAKHAEKQKLIDQARASVPQEERDREGFSVPVYRPPNFVLENKVGGK